MNFITVALAAITVNGGQTAPFDLSEAQELPAFVIRSYGSVVRYVANDGANILTGVSGYRFDRQYVLVKEYLDRLIFPPEGRTETWAKYTVNQVGASLEDNVALASLRLVDEMRGIHNPTPMAESLVWAVYPIDRLADPRPTDVLRTKGKARFVSATLKGRTLTAMLAENISGRIVLVDYVFQLAPRNSTGVKDARVLKRSVSKRGFAGPVSSEGKHYIERVAIGPGDVSQDRTSVIQSNRVISLIDGSSIEYNFGPFTSNADMFFIGNDLYQTLPHATTRTRDSKTFGDPHPYLGINKLMSGKWVRVSDLIMEAMSANGKYAVVKQLPKEWDGLPRRFVVKLK